MHDFRIHSLSLDQFIQMIKDDQGFSFARLSDGGFFCIWGHKGVNCDGVVYTQEQADSLISVIKDSAITHGLTSIAVHRARAKEWLEDQKVSILWYDADVMNKASDEGKLYPLIEYFRTRKTIICGPTHLKKFRGFPIRAFVECHPTAAFEEVDALEQEIAYRIDKTDADLVLLSAGQGASPTLVSRLHSLHPKINVIDVGSLWDPYVGVMSRSGHKKRGWREYLRLGDLNFRMYIDEWN